MTLHVVGANNAMDPVPHLPVSCLTAGVLGLFYMLISFKVMDLRNEFRVSMGTGGKGELAYCIRVRYNSL